LVMLKMVQQLVMLEAGLELGPGPGLGLGPAILPPISQQRSMPQRQLD
jgi:hypothetical protein